MKITTIILCTLSVLLVSSVCFAKVLPRCDKCHPKQNFRGKIVHKPVAQGMCTKCHNPHVAKYKSLLQQQGGDFCYSCHDTEKKTFAQGVQHQPVQEGKCLVCHSAHASDYKGLLARPITESCFGCHEDLAKKEFAVRHQPFASGNCVACHQPHQADNYQLLKDGSDGICLGCHKGPESFAGHKNFPNKVAACLSCHNPHGGKSKGMIRSIIHAPFKKGCTSCHGKDVKGSELCLSCHKGVMEQMLAPHSHMLVGDDSCVVCHSPHASDVVGLLNAPYKQLCRSCHTDTFERNRRSLHSHPETEKCTDCHEAHGSARLVMLNADGNALCSRCHETQGEFSHPVGGEVVDHRTGKVMTCLTCHDPMGTEYRYHLKLGGKKALCVQCHRSY